MSTSAQILANRENAQASTGPQTPEGKSISSQNGRSIGLYTSADYIRPGEQAEYDDLHASLYQELIPCTNLEHECAAEIHRALWRIRRCSLVEARLALASPLDPMESEGNAAKIQLSVDRARAQATRRHRAAMNDLRKLQTERHFRNETNPVGTDLNQFALADTQTVAKDLSRQNLAESRRELNEIEAYCKAPNPFSTELASLCKNEKQPAGQPRNALCRCNSGLKFKRCCGKNAPAQLRAA